MKEVILNEYAKKWLLDLNLTHIDNNFKDLLGYEDNKIDYKVKDAFKVYEIKEIEG